MPLLRCGIFHFQSVLRVFCIYMEKEIWKDVPSYEGIYQCSNLGRIKSLSRQKDNYCKYNYSKKKGYSEKFIGSKNIRTGYICCALCKNYIHKQLYAHEIVAITFLGYNKTNRKICINHIDGNRANNRFDNLEIISQSYNVKDGFNRGRVIHNKGKLGKESKCTKIIYVYDLNMNFIGLFNGAREASIKLGMSINHIKYNLDGRIKFPKYLFKYDKL